MLSMNGIDVDSRDECGDTPLKNAALNGYTEIVKMLLNHGAKIDSTSDDGCNDV